MNNVQETEKSFREEVSIIPTIVKTYNNGGIVELTVGKIESNGDWGHGGRSFVKIGDIECLSFLLCITDSNGEKHYFDKYEWQSIEILAGGEWERDALSKILSDSGHYLKDHVQEV